MPKLISRLLNRFKKKPKIREDTFADKEEKVSISKEKSYLEKEIEELQKKFELQEQKRLIEVEELQNKIKKEILGHVEKQMKEMLDNGEIVMK